MRRTALHRALEGLKIPMRPISREFVYRQVLTINAYDRHWKLCWMTKFGEIANEEGSFPTYMPKADCRRKVLELMDRADDLMERSVPATSTLPLQ